MNYSKFLEEANNATVQYRDLIKPAKIWRIKETLEYRGSHSSSYLSFSFVMEKNLKYPELGFNLVLNHSLNQRPICFLSEEDAKQFYDIYKNKAPDLHIDSLEVAGGRSSQELVRISKDGSIPVYGNKSSVEYLLRYDNNRVPEYVKNRLTGEAVISDMQKAKDLEKKKEEDRWVMFVKNYFAAVRELPGFHNLNDRLGFETYPLINPASACPIIEVTVNTYINTIPVLFELTIRFMNQKNIVLSHLLISNHYLFDSEHLRLLQDLHKFNITDFPIIVSAINDGNNSTIRTEIIYYKQPNKLKNTATKDEIKKYISDYLTEIREYLENIEIEEEI